MKKNKFFSYFRFLLIIFIFCFAFIPFLHSFKVYFKNKTLEIDKENILIINASDYKGKIRGIINFGNFIIKLECAYLDHQILQYKIFPTSNRGFIYLELEDGRIINKQYEVKGNRTKTSPLRIFYIEERNCVFSTTKNNAKNNIKDKNSLNSSVNTTQSNTENKKKESVLFIKEKKNYWLLFLVFFGFFTIFLAVAFYFYKLGKIEEKLEKEIVIEIKKIPKELEKISLIEDHKEKAFRLYNYLKENYSDKKNLKIKEIQDKLYLYSFKKELSEKEKEEIDKILDNLKKGDL